MTDRQRKFDSHKLLRNLPKVLGKTICDAVISEHVNGRIQFYLRFTDGTAYEFYTVDWLAGANNLEPGTVDDLLKRSRGEGGAQRVVPDRRRVERG